MKRKITFITPILITLILPTVSFALILNTNPAPLLSGSQAIVAYPVSVRGGNGNIIDTIDKGSVGVISGNSVNMNGAERYPVKFDNGKEGYVTSNALLPNNSTTQQAVTSQSNNSYSDKINADNAFDLGYTKNNLVDKGDHVAGGIKDIGNNQKEIRIAGPDDVTSAVVRSEKLPDGSTVYTKYDFDKNGQVIGDPKVTTVNGQGVTVPNNPNYGNEGNNNPASGNNQNYGNEGTRAGQIPGVNSTALPDVENRTPTPVDRNDPYDVKGYDFPDPNQTQQGNSNYGNEGTRAGQLSGVNSSEEVKQYEPSLLDQVAGGAATLWSKLTGSYNEDYGNEGRNASGANNPAQQNNQNYGNEGTRAGQIPGVNSTALPDVENRTPTPVDRNDPYDVKGYDFPDPSKSNIPDNSTNPNQNSIDRNNDMPGRVDPNQKPDEDFGALNNQTPDPVSGYTAPAPYTSGSQSSGSSQGNIPAGSEKPDQFDNANTPPSGEGPSSGGEEEGSEGENDSEGGGASPSFGIPDFGLTKFWKTFIYTIEN